MKTNRIVFMGGILIVLLLTLVGATSCSDDEDGAYQEVDGEVKEFTNEKGRLHYDIEENNWKFVRSIESKVFWLGDCEGVDITIVNWDPSFEEYKDDCVVSGTYRQVGFLPYPHEMPGGGTHYFEMTIQTISHIKY